MQRAPSFCGVILAAGESSRMGRPKALLPWKTGTFLSEGIRALNAHTDMVIVIAGKHADLIRPMVEANAGFMVVNEDPGRGQFSSLQLGLQEVLNKGRDAAIVTLVDRPPALSSTITLLKNDFMAESDLVWAVVPEFEGKHGHPIVVGREMITALLEAPPDANAREIEHANQPHIKYVAVEDPLVTVNVDTPEDFDRLLSITQEKPVSR
jgi:molybdenum cofactor cytidylyltransferase